MRFRLTHGMKIVLAFALAFGLWSGLKRRSEGFHRKVIEWANRAYSWDKLLIGPDGTSLTGPDGEDAILIMRELHRCWTVEMQFQIAEKQPWYPVDPDENPDHCMICHCF